MDFAIRKKIKKSNGLPKAALKSRAFFTFAVLNGVSIAFASPLLAEPRAFLTTDAKGNLKEKIILAIGEVDGAAQSAFEARKRSELAAQYSEDILRSEGYYQSQINFDVSDGDTPKALIDIKIGPQFTIENPQITWDGAIPPQNIQTIVNAALNLKNNSAANAQEVLDAEARVLGALLARGYANATTLPKKIIIDHETLKMRPQFIFSAGDIIKFGEVKINGETKTSQIWMQNVASIEKGQSFTPSALSSFEKRLLDTNAYDSVSLVLSPIANQDNTRDLEVTLKDRARFTIETQISYATTEGVAFEGSLARYNMFNRADSLINRLIYGDYEKRIESELRLPHFRAPDQTLAFSLGAFQDDTKAYRETGIEGKGDLTRKYGPTSFWTLGLAANIARTREPSFINPDTGIERDYYAANLIGAFLLDRTDNSLNPKQGFKADFKIEPTMIFGDARLDYIKMVGQGTYYKSLTKDERNIFAARTRLGSIIGGSIPELPSGRRFYAGGGGSVRGYEYQGIGPKYNDSDETPVGGLSLFETSLEIRHEFKNKFGIVAFIDTGSLGKDAAPDFSNFSAGYGIGMRYDLGFAPLRIDVGMPMDKNKGGNNFHFYIGVGQSF